MPSLEPLLTWVSLFEEAQEIKEYDDLAKKFYSLKIKVENNQEISEDDDKEFFRIVQTQWKRVIADKYNELREKVEKRDTKGQNFSNNLKELEKIRGEGEKDLRINEYYDLYVNMSELEKEIDEKIFIEKYQRRQSWNMLIIGLVIGFVLGIVSSIIASILLSIFKP